MSLSAMNKPQQGEERSEDTKEHSSNGNANEASPKPPVVLRKVGEKTPPGTLRKLSKVDRNAGQSCKSWCQEYSQTFLAKTIDTPLPDPGPCDEELE